MRSSHFIFFCLLFTAFFYLLLSVDHFHSPPHLLASEERPARKYLGTSFSNPKSEYQRGVKVREEEFNTLSAENISSNTPEYEASIKSADELVYHTDYHGVTTHPNPTPKHP